jgi:hypothetical protein
VRVLIEEVMLTRPGVFETDPIGYLDDRKFFTEHIVLGALLTSVNRVIHLVEQTEFH